LFCLHKVEGQICRNFIKIYGPLKINFRKDLVSERWFLPLEELAEPSVLVEVGVRVDWDDPEVPSGTDCKG
jgi:hypothetical protein